MGIDETRKRQPSVERHAEGIGLDPRRDRSNAAVTDTYVEQAIPSRDPGLAQHEVERHGRSCCGGCALSTFRLHGMVMAGLVQACPGHLDY